MEQHFKHTTLAQRLDVHPRTVINWIRAGVFGSCWLRRGAFFLIPASGVDQFERNHRGEVDVGQVRNVAGLRRGRG